MVIQYYFYFLIIIASVVKSHTYSSSEENTTSLLDIFGQRDALKTRILQTTCSIHCKACWNGVCYACDVNRVIPDCACKIGYYEDSGICQPCSNGCTSCTNSNVCSECSEQYSILNEQSNITCKCDTITQPDSTCNDPQSLYYTTELGLDLASIIIKFNNIISIIGVNDDLNFKASVDNCKILSQTSMTNYGIPSSKENTGVCYIDQSYQNRLVVVLGIGMIASKLLIPPDIIASNILILHGFNYFNPIPLIAITKQPNIGNQLNVVNQLCYFPYPKVLVKIGPLATILIQTPYLFKNVFSSSNQQMECTSDDSSKSNIISNCNDLDGLQIDTTSFSEGQTLTLNVKCTGPFKLQSIDSVLVTFTLNDISIDLSTKQNLITSSPQTLQQLTLLEIDQVPGPTQYSFNSYEAYPDTYQYGDDTSSGNSEKSQYLVEVNYGQAISGEQYFLIKVNGIQNTYPNVITCQEIAVVILRTKFTVDVTTLANLMELNPLQDFLIESTITDFDVKNFNQVDFIIKWDCVTILNQPNSPCKDVNGNLFPTQTDIQQYKLFSNSIPMSYDMYIVLTVTRKANIYSTQVKNIHIRTGTAQLTIQSPQYTLLYITDEVQFQFKYTNSLYSTSTDAQNIYRVQIEDDKGEKTMESNSPIITFKIYDIFPNLDLHVDHNIIFSFKVFDGYLFQTYNEPSLTYSSIITQPLSGCSILIDNDQPFIENIIQLVSCNYKGKNLNYQFFYYASKAEQQKEIISSGAILTRKMINLPQQLNQAQTQFPPGDLIFMAVLIENNNIIANFTLEKTIQESNFSPTTYEEYLIYRYNLAQQDQQFNLSELEILKYGTIINAIEYYEPNNPSYKPSSNINSMKISIIQRLSLKYWQAQQNSAYLFSAEINLRMKNTILSITPTTSEVLRGENQNNIAFTLQQIQGAQSQFTTEQRIYYQTYLSTSHQDLIKNMNNINNWDSKNSQQTVSDTNDVMNGISQTMLINQSPVTVESDGVSLQIQKLDYIKFMNTFYPNYSVSLNSPNASLTYYVSTQTWNSSHPIFRDEISEINSSYLQNTTNTTILELLQKKYPVIIPQVLTDSSKTRRVLSQNEANIQIPFPILFGIISEEERVTCIQKNSQTGKWVLNSCTVFEEIIKNERHVSCQCSTPTITSLIADVEELFNNQNVKDIFSSTGFWRIFTLENWYEYAPIWTILGLNICFGILVIVGYKYDKLDRQNDIKKAFLQDRRQNNQDKFKNENIFMRVKNNNVQINKKSNTNEKQAEENNSKIRNDKPAIDKVITIDLDAQQQQKQQEQTQQQSDQVSQVQQEEGKHSIQITFQQSNNLLFNDLKSLQSQTHTPNQRLLEKSETKLEEFPDLEENRFQHGEKQSQIQDFQMVSDLLKQGVNQNQDCNEDNNQQGQNHEQTENKQPNEINVKDVHTIQEVQKSRQSIYEIFEEQDVEVLSLGFNNRPLKNIYNQISAVQIDQERIKFYEDPPSIQSEQVFNQDQMNQIQLGFEGKESQEEMLTANKIDDIENHVNNCEVQKQNTENKTPNALTIIENITPEQQKTNSILINPRLEPSEVEQKTQTLSIEEQNKLQRKKFEEEQSLKYERSKMKLKEYLTLENIFKATFSFHIFLSTFIIYNARFSRILRFLIYYNKLVWNLAINSVFGVNLSIVQTIILSIITTIALQIITTIQTILCRYQKQLPLVLTVTTLFDLFCYYSVLVVVSGQNAADSNIWIGKYFLNILLQEFIIGIAISFGMYYMCKRFFDRLNIPFLFDILGAGLLMQAFQN